MSHESIKTLFSDAVNHIASNISLYVLNPDKDLTRNRKMGAANLISFLVSCGSSSTRLELLDFFGMVPNAPSASAFTQQRAKLKPDALEAVFHRFNSSVLDMETISDYRFLAADGSSFTFFRKPSFSSPEFFVSEGHSAKGFYSMHLNALYDLQKHTCTDALIQPVHQKDEFRAFCDRGYCSYNNMAHVMEKNQYFLFRTKDIHSKGLVGNFNFPDADSFDLR